MVAMRFHCCCRSSSRLELWKLIKNEMASGGSTFKNSAPHFHSRAGSETKILSKYSISSTWDDEHRLPFGQCRFGYIFGLFSSNFFHLNFTEIEEIPLTWPNVTHKTNDRAVEIMSRYLAVSSQWIWVEDCADSLELCYDTCTFALSKWYAKK